MFAGLRSRGRTPLLSHDGGPEVDAAFEKAFQSVAGSHETRLGLADDPFWHIEKRRLHAMLHAFVADEISRLTGLSSCDPAFFELAFGLRGASSDDAVEDASSTSRPVVVEKGGRRELLRGKIDRIDLCAGDGDTSPGGLFVIDYKLSTGKSSRDVASFRDMQMPCYLYAAPFVVPKAVSSTPCGASYRGIRTASGKKPVKSFADSKDYAAFCGQFTDVLHECAAAIRAGVFPPVPDAACEPYCPGRGVCRFNESDLEAPEGDSADA